MILLARCKKTTRCYLSNVLLNLCSRKINVTRNIHQCNTLLSSLANMAALLRIGQAHHLHGCLILAQFSHFFLPDCPAELGDLARFRFSHIILKKKHVFNRDVRVQLFSNRLLTHFIINFEYLSLSHRNICYVFAYPP